jgi:peptidoglycan/LPS O-acetylase OafA/YrhL
MSQPPPHAQLHVRAFDHVRALSAFSVVVHHIEQAKAILGLPGIWLAPWVQSLGTGGVDVFFGLSGFVITQSLLREGASRASALLGRFYLRRGLRILPLYLALVAVAFGPLPWLIAGAESQVGGALEGQLRARDEHYGVLLALHLLGLPNTALVAFSGVPFATHLWSVGAEMQFYLIWPLFFLLTRNVWTAAAIAAIATLLTEAILRNVGSGVAGLTPWTLGVIRQTLGTIHGRYLLAGICAAAFVSGPGARLGVTAGSRWLHWVALSTIAGLLLGRHLVPLTEWASPLLLAVALTGLALAPQEPGRRTSFADHLGRISYSIYVWHVLVIGLVAVAVDVTLGLQPWGPAPHLALYLGVVAATVVAATASFRFIEQPFLRLAAARR